MDAMVRLDKTSLIEASLATGAFRRSELLSSCGTERFEALTDSINKAIRLPIVQERLADYMDLFSPASRVITKDTGMAAETDSGRAAHLDSFSKLIDLGIKREEDTSSISPRVLIKQLGSVPRNFGEVRYEDIKLALIRDTVRHVLTDFLTDRAASTSSQDQELLSGKLLALAHYESKPGCYPLFGAVLGGFVDVALDTSVEISTPVGEYQKKVLKALLQNEGSNGAGISSFLKEYHENFRESRRFIVNNYPGQLGHELEIAQVKLLAEEKRALSSLSVLQKLVEAADRCDSAELDPLYSNFGVQPESWTKYCNCVHEIREICDSSPAEQLRLRSYNAHEDEQREVAPVQRREFRRPPGKG